MEKDREVIFDKNTIEFVTVAAEYCAFMERAREKRRDEWVDTALKLLPLLYLKASLIPPCERLGFIVYAFNELPPLFFCDKIGRAHV